MNLKGTHLFWVENIVGKKYINSFYFRINCISVVTGYGLCFTNSLIGVRWIMCLSLVGSIKYLSYNFRWPYSRESRK